MMRRFNKQWMAKRKAKRDLSKKRAADRRWLSLEALEGRTMMAGLSYLQGPATQPTWIKTASWIPRTL